MTTREVEIAAGARAVWDVVAAPAAHPRLDPRVRLVESNGADGTAGSSYVVAVGSTRLRYMITDAVPGDRLVADVFRGERRVAEQRGELTASERGVVLAWTVTQWAPWPLRGLMARVCRKALPRWLAAVEREATGAF
ncbi:SRPBCC family protein [Nocardioides ginsengisoli]|uniref:SRPBCC family protein n=1 Tax=Nocardioides ginsengisoli TaxID=363868 RepID=A0ABW3VXA7_9ACTN